MSKVDKKTKSAPDPVDIHVGNRLRARRILLGISQEKLADSVDLTFQQVQKYERGTNRISASRLYQFAKILDVPVAYFFEKFAGNSNDEFAQSQDNLAYGMSDNTQASFEDDTGEEDKLSADILYRKETLDLIRAYYSVRNEDIRKDFLKIIKSMADNMSSD